VNAGVGRAVEEFFAKYHQRTYARGDVVLFADDPALPVLYLESGQVCQYDVTSSGNRVICNIYKPGTFFPMSSAISRVPNRYFFEALSEVSLRQAPGADVVAFVRAHPDVMFDLLSRVYRGTDGLLRRMTELMSGTARERLLGELRIAAERFGVSQPDEHTLVVVTETQLAQQTGLARETVSRELQQLKREGVVKTSKAGLVIALGCLEGV
jgi:CRP-like cAMP-binding protein